MLFTVTIPGDPVAQGRPRFSARGGFARAYDPAKSREWKARAAAFIRLAMEDHGVERIDDGCVEVTVLAIFARPKSKNGKRGELALMSRHSSRGDADNLAKSVLDSSSGIAFRDDAQVSDLIVRKRIAAQGEAPRVVVSMREVPAEVRA